MKQEPLRETKERSKATLQSPLLAERPHQEEINLSLKRSEGHDIQVPEIPHGPPRSRMWTFVGFFLLAFVVAFGAMAILVPAVIGTVYEFCRSWLSFLLNPATAKGGLLIQSLAVLLSVFLAFGIYQISTIRSRRLHRIEELLRNTKTDLDTAIQMMNTQHTKRAKESVQLASTALSHVTGRYKRRYGRFVGERAWNEIETAERLIADGYKLIDDETKATVVSQNLEEARAAVFYAERLVALAY